MKAQQVMTRLTTRHPQVVCWCPQLPPSPAAAMALVMDDVRDWPRATMAVVGSSLGGFYARWLALQTGCARAVLLNPAAFPARDLLQHVGEHSSWHDPAERFVFHHGHVNELRAQEADIARLAPLRPASPRWQFALVAQGDEVLDWREMAAFCASGHTTLLPGGDHALSDFDHHIDAVFQFLGLVG